PRRPWCGARSGTPFGARAIRADRRIWPGEICRKQDLPLVPALEEGPSKGAAPRLVHQPGGRRFCVDLDLFGVEGEDGEDVAVLPGALGRGGADVALCSGVVREVKGAWRQTRAGLVAGAGGQLGDVAGNVHHGPVPEAEDRGRFGVDHRDHEALCPCAEAAPGELLGDVPALGTEDAVDLWPGQLLALLLVLPRPGEGGGWGTVVVGVP